MFIEQFQRQTKINRFDIWWRMSSLLEDFKEKNLFCPMKWSNNCWLLLEKKGMFRSLRQQTNHCHFHLIDQQVDEWIQSMPCSRHFSLQSEKKFLSSLERIVHVLSSFSSSWSLIDEFVVFRCWISSVEQKKIFDRRRIHSDDRRLFIDLVDDQQEMAWSKFS